MTINIQTMIERINDTFHQQVQSQINQVHQTLTQNMHQMQTTIVYQIQVLQNLQEIHTNMVSNLPTSPPFNMFHPSPPPLIRNSQTISHPTSTTPVYQASPSQEGPRS